MNDLEGGIDEIRQGSFSRNAMYNSANLAERVRFGTFELNVRTGELVSIGTARRAVESVLDGYGIEKSSVRRQFVAASSNQLRALCERRLEDLNLVVLMIDGVHVGGQVLVVALGIAESGEKHVLGVWQGATENTTVRLSG